MTDSGTGPDPHLLQTRVGYLEELATRESQTWRALAEKHGVDQQLPPWKTDLDGLCDALDDVASQTPGVATFAERRSEEDLLVGERYGGLPFPENQLLALAHSLIVRGIIDEKTLEARTREVKERLSG